MKERKLETAYDVVVVRLHGELVKEQHNITDCVDMAVEVDIAVFEAVDGFVAVRLDTDVLLLHRYRAFAFGDPFRFEVESGESGVAAVFNVEHHPDGAGITIDIPFRIGDGECAA